MESLKGQTTGADIFEKIDNCLTRYNLQWNKMVSVTTDRVPCLTGKNVRALKKIQDKICENYPDYNLITIHCIIHQQILCKNVLKVEHVTSCIIQLVNLIQSRGMKQTIR
mgnify:CR=1 FL=1